MGRGRFLRALPAALVGCFAVFSPRLCAQCLQLDALLPPGLHQLLPSLWEVRCDHCTLAPASSAVQLDAACTSLQRLELLGTAVGTAWDAQLAQLSRLPKLSSLSLPPGTGSTAFLPTLSSHLTALELAHAYPRLTDGEQQPTPAWEATLQHVAQCTRLQALTIPCATAQEVSGLVSGAGRTVGGAVGCEDGWFLTSAG